MVTVAKYNNVKKLSINGSFFQVQLYLSSYQKMKEKSSIFLVFLYTEITVTWQLRQGTELLHYNITA